MNYRNGVDLYPYSHNIHVYIKCISVYILQLLLLVFNRKAPFVTIAVNVYISRNVLCLYNINIIKMLIHIMWLDMAKQIRELFEQNNFSEELKKYLSKKKS